MNELSRLIGCGQASHRVFVKPLRQAFFAVVLTSLLLQDAAAAIPPDRLPPAGWNAGIPGGIPTNYTMFCNVRVAIPGTSLVAKGDGVTDDAPAIQAAVNACPNGKYVYIPEGNYRLNSGISRSGKFGQYNIPQPFSIVIRGDGPDKTRLRCYSDRDNIISFGAAGGVSGWYGVTGVARGSTNLVVKDSRFPPAQSLPAGKWVVISRNNATSNATNGVPTYMTSTASQIVKIITRNGTNLTIWPPINESYPGTIANASAQPFRCGIEDLYVERAVSAGMHNIVLSSAEECWVKNVESVNPRKWNIRLQTSAGCEIRRCILRGTSNGGGDSGYGVGMFAYSCNNLVEDNIAERCRHSFIIEYGGQNNVFGYNYSFDPINENQDRTDYLMGDLCLHGGVPRFNLFEGNVAATIKFDRVLGGNEMNTVFRNQIQRKGIPATYVACMGSDIQRWNYDNSLVGNVYEKPPERYPYPLRRWGTDQDNGTNPDLLVEPSTLLDGEVDIQAGRTIWKNGPRALPTSLYLQSKPAWWDGGAWPAIGPDVVPATGANPAYRRWHSRTAQVAPPGPPSGVLIVR